MKRSRVFKKLPKEVQVGRATYQIVRGMPEKDHDGLVIFDDRIIWIDEELDDDQAETTLLHELIHVIAHHEKLPLSEKKVLALEKGLYTLLKKNGWKIVRNSFRSK